VPCLLVVFGLDETIDSFPQFLHAFFSVAFQFLFDFLSQFLQSFSRGPGASEVVSVIDSRPGII